VGLRLVEAGFTDEDKKNLKVIAEELKETLEILSDEKLMKSIHASQKDLEKNRVLSYKELLADLNIDERALSSSLPENFLKNLSA
jgi:hypothetical protein